MSLGNDFLQLIEKLWDIEQFNMWNPKEHSSLAYLLDRSADSPRYRENYEKWLLLAQNGEFNEFAWTVVQAELDACRGDERISEEEITALEDFREWLRESYEDGCLSAFGLIKEEYVPDWFFELFGTYIKLEELKREDAVTGYLMKECSMSEKRAQTNYDKLYQHYDILNEFYFYVRRGRYKSYNPIRVKGYTAQQLEESTYLSPAGAYNYLVSLRERPEEALDALKKGLPR